MKETDPLDDLLTNIDKLTKPIRRKEVQDTIAGQPPKTVKIVLPPLLTQLEDAVRGSIGIGGSGSLASERNLLDSDALQRFLIIKARIGEWARDAQAVVDPVDPAATLRRWYLAWTQKPRDNGPVRFYAGKTAAWIEQIEEKLDPARVRELPEWCPDCMADSWWNPADKQKYLHPLIVEYKPTGADMIENASAKCRACDTKWGIRQLAYELEQIEKARQEGRDEVRTALTEDVKLRARVHAAAAKAGVDRPIDDPFFDIVLEAASAP